jgi:hypothetical protein
MKLIKLGVKTGGPKDDSNLTEVGTSIGGKLITFLYYGKV